METVLWLCGGAIAGALGAWLYFRSARAVLEERLVARERQIQDLEAQGRESKERIEALEKERTALKVSEAQLTAQLAALEEARQRLGEAFKVLSDDALRSNNRAFLELAKETLEKYQIGARGELESRQTAIQELVKPLGESLGKVEREIQELEKTRAGAYEGLSQQVRSLAETQTKLHSETANLVSALRAPKGGADGARSNSSEWLKWPACLNTATSSSRNRRPRKAGGCAPTWWSAFPTTNAWWWMPRRR